MSFDVPLPANYGGVIDVFYKLKTLSESGYRIILHVFNTDREVSKSLEDLCEKVYCYPRNSFIISFFSFIPFIVKSRASSLLMENLNKDNYPILFEGIHTTAPLLRGNLNQNRIKMIRIHNIEHRYYRGLAKSEKNIFKKIFFLSESIKLKNYEKIVNKVDVIFPLSIYEKEYYERKYPKVKKVYLPIFHENKTLNNLVNSVGKFALYHGDLKVADNTKAAAFLIKIFQKIKYPLIIAGNSLPKSLLNNISKSDNITFVNLQNDSIILEELFKNAQINILPSFQKTGIKLKLINALYKSRFVIGNDPILKDTGLEELAYLANTREEYINAIAFLQNRKFSQADFDKRCKILSKFDVQKNMQKIIEIL